MAGYMAGERSHRSGRASRALDAVNFFLADVRDGLGPYLAIYRLTVPEVGRGQHRRRDVSAAFLTMAEVAAVGLVVFMVAMPETRTERPAQLDRAATAAPRRVAAG